MDLGEGFREDNSIPIPVSRKGTIQELIRLPAGVRGLRWDPMEAPGEIEQSPITMTEVGTLERVLRMMRRVIPVLWLHPLGRRTHLNLTAGRMFAALEASYRAAGRLRAYAPAISYEDWITRNDTLGQSDRDAIRRHIGKMDALPVISVLMPLHNATGAFLRRALDSVCLQLYPHWELCVSADGSSGPEARALLESYRARGRRIRIVTGDANGEASAALNGALGAAAGEYVTVLREGDELSEHALYHLAVEINRHPGAELLYGDEDSIGADGRRHAPQFKPRWNPDLFYSQNYLSHAVFYRTSLLKSVGGYRRGFDACAGYDLALRCIARVSPQYIRHVPAVLYHARAAQVGASAQTAGVPAAGDACIRALREHFAKHAGCTVAPGRLPETFRVRYPVPDPAPRITLVVPTRDMCHLLRKCVESIVEKTTYPNWELIVVNNQSVEADTLAYLAAVVRNPRIHILNYEHPFNYSAMNNLAVRQSSGHLIGLINNDVEVIEPDWLTEMVSHALRPEVGCVGAKLCYSDNRIQHAGVVLGQCGTAGHAHRFFHKDAAGYCNRLQTIQAVSAVTGACLVVRRELYEMVGGLNEIDLKVSFNDVDFCLKVREAGYRNIWTPYAELYHHESATRGGDSTPGKTRLTAAEAAYIRRRWKELVANDPFYSPFLTRERENFTLSEVPWVAPPWRLPRRTRCHSWIQCLRQRVFGDSGGG